MEYG
jgi:hypothetical protein